MTATQQEVDGTIGGDSGNTGTGADDKVELNKFTLSSVNVGQYVDYVPNSGTYPSERINVYSGVSSQNIFSTETDIKWRIWSVDDTTLTLIANRPTKTTLTLSR